MYTYSVSKRARTVTQPRGGYLPLQRFSLRTVQDGFSLKEGENISAGIMGQTVDYMSRLVSGRITVRDAFRISLLGTALAGQSQQGEELVTQINGLDDASLRAACKLASYDVYARTVHAVPTTLSKPEPNQNTLFNIRLMVTRMVRFFAEYGPVTADGFTMEGGYTDIVSCGDGDFLTKDTLWDIKTSHNPPQATDTLQVLMYYIMGNHSWNDCFQTIQNIGIVNPRLNQIWLLNAGMIPAAVIQQVERDVIGY